MPLLVRKITKAKWFQNKILEGEEPSADAITSDLRTNSNCLSIWEIKSEDELEDAVLAIASSGDCLNTIDIIVINSDNIFSNKLKINESEGFTPYADFINRHRDIIDLAYLIHA